MRKIEPWYEVDEGGRLVFNKQILIDNLRAEAKRLRGEAANLERAAEALETGTKCSGYEG